MENETKPENKKGEVIKKKGGVREYAEALFSALLIAFFIRSFAVEAFKIPSGSMIPTLLVGDHIFVNKFIYGLRLPFTKIKLLNLETPKRGEAIVFIYPLDESKDFIKRVVGLPGDKIRLDGNEIYINGAKLERKELGVENGFEEETENLGGRNHLVQYLDRTAFGKREITVPPDHLFMMGDNRDNSSDSREWGFVPIENVKGKAMFIWLSIDYDNTTIRWNRFGKWIH
jgi:signal peptidase I